MLKAQEKYDKYTIMNHLCDGGTSHIYEVADEEEEPAILKIVKQPTTNFTEQLENEARILAKMNHTNIPKLYDKMTINRQYRAIVMEQIEGNSFAELIETKKRRFTSQEILDFAKQIANLIRVFHTSKPKIIIRDLKPSNLILTNDKRIYLIDFGTALSVNESKQVQAMGTIGFAAPEQFETGVIDLRSDLFSLGASLFYIATGGQNIYTVHNKKMLKEYVSKSFYHLIMKLTENDVVNRFESIQEVIHVLNKVKVSWKEHVTNLIG